MINELPLLLRERFEGGTIMLDSLEEPPVDCGMNDVEDDIRFWGHVFIEIDFLFDDVFDRDDPVDFLLKSQSS